MGRLLVLALVVVVLIWLLRRAADDGDSRASPDAGREGKRGNGGDAARRGASRDVDHLVRCAACGLHLPANEARRVKGRYYCSDEHARRAAGEA